MVKELAEDKNTWSEVIRDVEGWKVNKELSEDKLWNEVIRDVEEWKVNKELSEDENME